MPSPSGSQNPESAEMRTGRAAILGVAGALVLGIVLPSPRAVAETADPYANGLLWRIETPRRAPSHIFATLHVADERVRDLPGPVRTALIGSKTLTVEVIVDRAEEAQLARLAQLPGGRTLDHVLGPELFARTVRAVSPLGLSADDIRPFKPWYVAGILGTHPDETIRRAGGRLSLDAAVARMAAIRGHRVLGLQSASEHFRRFDRIDTADQIKLLAHAVDRPGGGAKHYERVLRHYLARDLAALRGAMADLRAGDDPDLRRIYLDRLIEVRNKMMARRLQRRLKAGGAFVAIGAAHLPGEKGVLNLLARRGFNLRLVY